MGQNYEELESFGMKIRLVPIEKVKIAKTNIRDVRDQETIDRMRANIQHLEEMGLQMPLLSPPLATNDNEIFEGGYRLEGMRKAGKAVIPLRIVDVPEDQQIIISLSGGIQHPLSGEDEAKAIAKLRAMDEKKWSYEKIGKAVGRSRRHIIAISGLNTIKKGIREDIEQNARRGLSAKAIRMIAQAADIGNFKSEVELTENDRKEGKISREEFVKIGVNTSIERLETIKKRLNSEIPIDWKLEKNLSEEKSKFYNIELALDRAKYESYREFCINNNLDVEALFIAGTDMYIETCNQKVCHKRNNR